jgi:hypothetical protein
MIHFLPESSPETQPAPYAEAVARLASIRQALRLVEKFEGDRVSPNLPSSDVEERITAAWPTAKGATRRCFTARSERTANAAAAGLEVLLSQRVERGAPNPASVEQLADAIREGISDLDRLLAR